MARPADAVDKVAEKLRDLWDGLVKHEKRFRSGDDKQFYEVVEKCFDELWVGDEAKSTRQVIVWKRLKLEPAEQERRIRETVGPGLREARRLKYTRSDVTSGVDVLGQNVDMWFGGETTTKQTEADRLAKKMRSMLAELNALVEKYAQS